MKHFTILTIFAFSVLCCFSQQKNTVMIDSVEFTNDQIVSIVSQLEYKVATYKVDLKKVPDDLLYHYKTLSSIKKTFNDGHKNRIAGSIFLGFSVATVAFTYTLPVIAPNLGKDYGEGYGKGYYITFGVISMCSAIAGTTFLCIGFSQQNKYNNRKTEFNLGILKDGKIGLGVDF